MRRSNRRRLVVLVVLFAFGGSLATRSVVGQQFSVNPDKLRPVPVQAGLVRLSPENSLIEFMGTHAGENIAPRLGGFSEFSGEIAVEEGTIRSVTAEINIASVWTQFSKLTTHLKAPDFFDVDSFATARFVSSEITAGTSPGEITIQGTLTFHGATQPLTLPGKVAVHADGVTLVCAFKLDRRTFEMKDHTDSVDPLVAVSVVVGQKTAPRAEQDRAVGGQRRRRDSAPATPKEPPVSGLRVGESVEPWTPVHVSGPDKGTNACPVCNYWNRPAIVVFAKDNANTAKLLGNVESLLEQHDTDELKCFFVVLDGSPERLAELAKKAGLARTALCYLNSESRDKDLAAYKIHPSVQNTVMVYQGYQVAATLNDLSGDDLETLPDAVKAMLNESPE